MLTVTLLDTEEQRPRLLKMTHVAFTLSPYARIFYGSNA